MMNITFKMQSDWWLKLKIFKYPGIQSLAVFALDCDIMLVSSLIMLICHPLKLG